MTTRKKSPRRASRSDGIHSRETILNAAARLATVEGLEGMSIGRLAEHIGMSKSGIYAHFGSKEELQLATVETASEIFDREVMCAGDGIADPAARLSALGEAYLAHVERDVFPGGCFFVAALSEFDMRPGPVLDEVKRTIEQWMTLLAAVIREAQAAGVLRSDEEPEQLAWELDAFLVMGNLGWVMSRDAVVLERARRAFAARMGLARLEQVAK